MAPQGRLTGTQVEIMDVVWDATDDGGIKAAEIWSALSLRREVARTTVLTMVQRLEKRGWLVRTSSAKVVRYRAALSREAAAGSMAAGFLDEFFDGSAALLVSSLLGSRRIKKAELNRLRKLLAEKEDS